MALFLQVSSSLAPMQYTGVCRIAQLPNRGWLLGFGREVFFPRHKCSVERTEYLMEVILLDYIYLYILLLYYIAICLYIYIVIALFIYCVVCLLLYCMRTAWRYYFLYIYILFCSLLRPLFFMIVLAVSLSFGFLPCKGMAVLSDTKHQAKPYSAKTFSERLPQMLHIWVFQKTFYRIVWCSDSWEPPFLYARKKAT